MDLELYREIAIMQAVRLRLSPADVEDCASLFVCKLLEKQNARTITQFENAAHKEAWLHRCARNHALNYSRGLRRLQQRQIPWLDSNEETYIATMVEVKPSPLARCLRREAVAEALAAVDTLSEQALFLFIAHHIDGRSLVHLAQSIGKNSNAVSQAVFRARVHVRQQLERRGWTEHDFVKAMSDDIERM